jgi:hypothetical protein
MIKELKKLHSEEPACQKRSDRDHLRFVIYQKKDNEMKFDFTIELNGTKSWTVPELPSMDPLDQLRVDEDENDKIPDTVLEQALTENALQAWDRGNYIPIDDNGNVLSEYDALKCLEEGVLKFFLQGSKLVGEFVLMKKENHCWLLLKRHDEFALYKSYYHDEITGEF